MVQCNNKMFDPVPDSSYLQDDLLEKVNVVARVRERPAGDRHLFRNVRMYIGPLEFKRRALIDCGGSFNLISQSIIEAHNELAEAKHSSIQKWLISSAGRPKHKKTVRWSSKITYYSAPGINFLTLPLEKSGIMFIATLPRKMVQGKPEVTCLKF